MCGILSPVTEGDAICLKGVKKNLFKCNKGGKNILTINFVTSTFKTIIHLTGISDHFKGLPLSSTYSLWVKFKIKTYTQKMVT